MADGEGDGDPRDSSGKKCSALEELPLPREHRDSPPTEYRERSPVQQSRTENGGGPNGTYSDNDSMDGSHQDGPLDFSVRKSTSAIPVQNLYNKLANGLHRRPPGHHEHGKANSRQAQRDYDVSEDKPQRDEVSNSDGDRDRVRHALKTEAISPPPSSHMNGMSPISDASLSRNSSANSPEVPRIGEPQIAMPGLLPGAGLPGGAAGLLPMFHAGLLPSSGLFNGLPLPQDTNGSSHEQNGKSGNPFKSLNKDQLAFPPPFGALPALPQMSNLDMIAAQAMASNSEEVFAQYKQYLMAIQDQLRAQRSPGGSSTSSSSQGTPRQPGSVSGVHSPTGSSQDGTPLPPTSGSTPFVLPTSPQSSSRPYLPRSGNSSSRKRGRPLPDAMKDEAYWERRRKNNDAAKRSRDSRRAKEDQIAMRAAFLEQENLKLRVEVTALKNETAKLRCMLYNS